MAEKLLKETKDTQTKRNKTKKVAEEDDIYKIDLTLESPENEDDFKAKDLESEEKEEKTKAKRGRKSKNVVKVVEDDEEVDEIFGNINKWINEDEIEENLEKEPEGKLIISPLVGTFYAAPAEDAPSFVKVGDKVGVGQVVGIVEAMKLMNEIESECAGTVAEVLVENGEPVEYGQPLFRIV